ncbi:MAG: class I SAM-dependent methyltransferase [Inquilinaceae bacterium]
MLYGLKGLLTDIERQSLPEAAIYARERLYHRPAGRPPRPGPLTCPICGTRAQRFLPFGLFGRRNAQCPTCGSVERHRFLWLYLVRSTRLLNRRVRMLHTAPETCLEHRLRQRRGLRYTTVDLFNPTADVQADLTDLPFADGAFDVVLTSHVLEHIPDDKAAMAELARILRPGGEAIVMVPFDPRVAATPEDPANDTPAKRMAAYGHPYHYRYYGADLPVRLAAAGLSPRRVVTSRTWLPGHQRRRFRINRNHLFHCVRE